MTGLLAIIGAIGAVYLLTMAIGWLLEEAPSKFSDWWEGRE